MNAELVREILDYDPLTGVFRWRVPMVQHRADGVAGHPMRDRWRISYKSREYEAHRLAWLYMHGEWPKQFIDHIDGNALNNRIANLRDVSRQINVQNRRSADKDSLTGVLGATARGRRFRSQIAVNNKNISLGTFDTALEAHRAYLKAKQELHPHAYV